MKAHHMIWFGICMLMLAACAKADLRNVDPAEQHVDGKTVHVYSARHYQADRKLYDEFERQTGIKVIETKGTAEELVRRIQQEQGDAGADLFLTVDGGVLHYARNQGVLQPITDETVLNNVPEQWRDEDGYWVGLTTRARVIAYSLERVKPADLSTYEALTDPRWRGKLLVRSSASLYNQSLLAAIIAAKGEEAARSWVRGTVANFARAPEGGDKDQIMALAAGSGDLALVNTYYIGQMLFSSDAEEVKAARSVGVFFPNQQTTGTHVNISGIGLTKHAPAKEEALKLLAFLTGEEAQTLLTNTSYEFPVNPHVVLPDLLTSWGGFLSQDLVYRTLADNHATAVKLMSEEGWN